MASKSLPFGDLKPDLAAHEHDGVIVANNVIPIANGYAPLKAFVAVTAGTLPAACLGAASFKSSTRKPFTIAGTATNLYLFKTAGWVSVGAGFNASPEFVWRFEQFGDRIIASNGIDPVQSVPMVDVPVTAALAGSPPTMQLLTTVRDFIVGGVIDGDAAKVAWSGINNSTVWTFGAGQSDYNKFPVGGAVTGITGGEYGLVLQENRITRMTYIGGNLIFQFDEISANIGCVARRSICRYGSQVFFLSNRGFMMCDGEKITPIGNEKIDRTFLALADMKQVAGMSAAVDPINKLAIWTVPVTSGTPQTWFIYNFILDRWSTATQAAQFLISGVTPDYSLEDLDAFSASLDTLTPSLGDNFWTGANPTLYVINGSSALGTMTGANSAATFTLPDLDLAPGRSIRLRRVRPVCDAVAGVTVTLAGRQRLGDTLVTTTHTALSASGDVPTRRNVRSVRPTLALAAGASWSFAQAIEVGFEAGSKR